MPSITTTSSRRGWVIAFRNEAWSTLQRIREFPLAWQPLGGTIRRCQIQHFPYGVIYEPAVAEIVVVAIAHLHREPGY